MNNSSDPSLVAERVQYGVDGETATGTLVVTPEAVRISGDSPVWLPVAEIHAVHVFLGRLLILVRPNRRDVVLDSPDVFAIAAAVRSAIAVGPEAGKPEGLGIVGAAEARPA